MSKKKFLALIMKELSIKQKDEKNLTSAKNLSNNLYQKTLITESLKLNLAD